MVACQQNSTPKEIKSLITIVTFVGKSSVKLPASASEKDLLFFDSLEDYVEIEVTKKEEKDDIFSIEGNITCHDLKRVGGILEGLTLFGTDKLDIILSSVNDKISKIDNYKAETKSQRFVATYKSEDEKLKLVSFQFAK